MPKKMEDLMAAKDQVRAAVAPPGKMPYYLAPPDATAEEGASGGLLAYWHLVLQHAGKIGLAGGIGLLLGLAVSLPAKKVWRAVTSIEVLSMNQDFMNMRSTMPVVQGQDSGDLSEEETQAALLQSTPLIDKTLQRMGRKPDEKSGSALSRLLHVGGGAAVTDRDKALDKAADSIKVTNKPRTRILDVSVDSTDGTVATEFANALVSEYLKKNLEARILSSQQTNEWLNSEISAARKRLQTSEHALQDYARNSGLIFTDSEQSTNLATEKLQQLQSQLSTVTTDRIAKQAAYELAKKSPPDSLPAVVNDPGLQLTETKLNDAKRQLASLSAIYAPGYSKLKAAQAEVEALQQAFDHQRADLLAKIETEYKDASRKEGLLTAAFDSQTRAVTGQDERAVQYNVLKRDVDSNRQLYDTMLQQMNSSSLASALRASNVRVLDPAYLLPNPVSPNVKMDALLGMALGVLGSLGWILLHEQTNRRLRRPGDVKLYTDLPELGAIPQMEMTRQRNVAQSARSLLHPKFEVSDTQLVGWQEPTMLAESFRAVLASIFLAHDNGVTPRTLVVTSAEAGEGKTTMVSNIAIASAEIGQKVIIVDADLRRPRVHEMFGVSNKAGLADLLHAEQTSQSVLARVQKTRIPGLSVLTAGPSTMMAAQVFYSPKFVELLTQLRREYDLVLIDTPPMLQITDARVIGRLADAVVLVARAGQTTRETMLAAKERLEGDRIRVLGTVLNHWKPQKQQAAYYYAASAGKLNG